MFLDHASRIAVLRRGRRSSLREPWLLGFVFVGGLALGALLPWHASSPASWPGAGAGSIQPAEVLRVIDGDPFEARVRLWPGLEMTTRVRLRGIDAPELKSACADEFDRAQAARQALETLLAVGHVAIFNIGPDKYHGRVVADAQTPQTPDVSAALLAAAHGEPHPGGGRGGGCALARCLKV